MEVIIERKICAVPTISVLVMNWKEKKKEIGKNRRDLRAMCSPCIRALDAGEIASFPGAPVSLNGTMCLPADEQLYLEPSGEDTGRIASVLYLTH